MLKELPRSNYNCTCRFMCLVPLRSRGDHHLMAVSEGLRCSGNAAVSPIFSGKNLEFPVVRLEIGAIKDFSMIHSVY